MLRRILFCTGLSLIMAGSSHAQAGSTAPPQIPQTITVFLDCGYCDGDFMRTEISYVNWVRDRTVADVHILVTAQGTGGGGTAFTLAFLGQRAFGAVSDTLTYASPTNSTSDEQRRGLLTTIKAGLVRYLVRTSAAPRLQVSLSRPPGSGSTTQTAPKNDPWHAWVFRIGANGYTSGEKTYKSLSSFTNLSASRTTEEWKNSVSLYGSYDESKTTFDFFDDAGVPQTERFTTIQRNWGASTEHVMSLTGHLSAGIDASLGSNSFTNQKHYARIAPAVEWDLYPYAEATRRQLRVLYGVGVNYFAYEDTTIFFRIRETLPTNYLNVSYSSRQPWGSANLSANHNRYLNDGSKNNTRVSGSMNVRVFRGLNVNFGGGYSWIHDQLYLRKGEREQSEVLLRQQQLFTAFRYNLNAGLSYTFGSIFNNVVNPRFGGGGDCCFD